VGLGKKETPEREGFTSKTVVDAAWLKCYAKMPSKLVQGWIEKIEKHGKR
jgi:hypothetical protein